MIMKVTTALGREVDLTDKYFVTATDKTMSGWGRAEGKIAKRVIVCDTWRQVQRIADAMINKPSREGWRYINKTSRLPRYSEKKYVVSWSHYDEFNNPYFMSTTHIPAE